MNFKKVEGEAWPGDDTKDRGEMEDSNSEGCMEIEGKKVLIRMCVKDIWAWNNESINQEVFCDNKGLDD